MNRRQWLAALAGLSPALYFGARVAWPRPAPRLDDPTTLSRADLMTAFASGRLTPLDVTHAYLSRIADLDPALGAFVTVTRERALADARRLTEGAAAGPLPRPASKTPAPLWGVPLAHKDLFATRGIRTTGGSKLHETWIPDADAALVARLAQAGTVLVGKTNTHELGGGVTTINPFFGTTHNPVAPARIAGGSSGGSAAAVAARLALLATGSDTGGSIRIPAALCGCVGLKPTFGLLPTTGLLGACPTFDHAGVIARSAEDAAWALSGALDPTGLDQNMGDAIGGRYGTAVARGVKGLRVGVARDYFFTALEPGVRAAVEQTLTRLRAAGARVEDVATGLDEGSYTALFDPIAVSEIRATYAREWRATPGAFSKDFAAVFAGEDPSAVTVAAARDALAAFQQSLTDAMGQLDVLVTPTVPMVAPRLDGPMDGMRILRNTWPFNAARLPAVTVPCGTGEGGLPVGLQLVGSLGDDATLLGIATAVTRL